MSGLTREEVIEQLEDLTGIRIKLATYKKWETRTPLPHHLIIPFCQITGSEPYMLLTGVPFRLGQPRIPRNSGDNKHAA